MKETIPVTGETAAEILIVALGEIDPLVEHIGYLCRVAARVVAILFLRHDDRLSRP